MSWLATVQAVDLVPPSFNWKEPDYDPVYQERKKRLDTINRCPELLPGMRAFYRENPAQFISDWGMTFDPKQIEKGRPSVIPFILFPRQREWVETAVEHWKAGKPLLTDKTRQMGFSWLAMALSCTLSIFYDGMAIGFGSRKAEYVDKTGDPKSLFWKGRFFMRHLPEQFRGGWLESRDATMRITFPDTGSYLTGESGDNIGRGATTSIYFVDEAAFLEQPHLVEASLSQTTNCRIDISTPNGMGNPFAQKRFSGRVDVFTFNWWQDPRKDQAWYDAEKARLDPVTFAQEIDIDYTASVSGIVIPGIWVRAALDAHKKLGIKPTGQRMAALDIADEGPDKIALVGATGIVVEFLNEWSGSGSDIFKSVQQAFDDCDREGYQTMLYDGDGMGADVRGDARVINERRTEIGFPTIAVKAFRGSGELLDPEREDVEGRKNKDFFANPKAQGWWRLRKRFEATHKALADRAEGKPDEFDPDGLISIDSTKIKPQMLAELMGELSQPTYSLNGAGKILINKTPPTTRSPNKGDSVMMRFSGVQAQSVVISDEALQWARSQRR